jgi:amidase
MSTYLRRVRDGSGGLRLAVKDSIDVAGLPTTMGCRVLAQRVTAPMADAACLAGARAVNARIVGKTNLSELCHSGSGVNDYFATPVNPIDRRRVPGGSSAVRRSRSPKVPRTSRWAPTPPARSVFRPPPARSPA